MSDYTKLPDILVYKSRMITMVTLNEEDLHGVNTLHSKADTFGRACCLEFPIIW